MFWTRLYKYFFARSPKQRLTIRDFYAMDTDVEDDNVYDREGVDIENGEIVGETAIITADKDLQPTNGPLPDGYPFPSFSRRSFSKVESG